MKSLPALWPLDEEENCFSQLAVIGLVEPQWSIHDTIPLWTLNLRLKKMVCCFNRNFSPLQLQRSVTFLAPQVSQWKFSWLTAPTSCCGHCKVSLKDKRPLPIGDLCSLDHHLIPGWSTNCSLEPSGSRECFLKQEICFDSVFWCKKSALLIEL